MDPTRFSIIFARDAHAALVRAALPGHYVCVKNRVELAAQLGAGRGAVSAVFADVELLAQSDGERLPVPIVAILDGEAHGGLTVTVGALLKLPWLSHVVTTPLLASPGARAHLGVLLDRLAGAGDKAALGPSVVGRVAKLAGASRREMRFERIREFFASHGMSARTLSAIGEVAEELVMNALYDAPVEGGFFAQAVPRTEDVELPAARACEISYGLEGGNAFLRVRDTFGSLTRARLLDVLRRCNATTVALDESRGGAGLGLWRVMSTASTIAITVVTGTVTDILVVIATRDGRITRELLGLDLFFQDSGGVASSLHAGARDDDRDDLEHSIALVVS